MEIEIHDGIFYAFGAGKEIGPNSSDSLFGATMNSLMISMYCCLVQQWISNYSKAIQIVHGRSQLHYNTSTT